MAKLNKSVLGKVSGALGDITFRQKNGKNYLAMRPASFIPGNDEASVARRAKFKLGIKFSKAVNDTSLLKSIWDSETPPDMNTFNFIFKNNYQYMGTNSIPSSVKITPSYGFMLSGLNASHSSSNIITEFDALSEASGIDSNIELTVKVCTILFLSNPVNDNSEEYTFLKFISAEEPVSFTDPYQIQTNFSNVESQIYNSYQDYKMFSVLVTLDSEQNPVNYSSIITA